MVAVCVTTTAIATPFAQSDLDDLMSRVLARRDDNWKKLQQYTLNERETVQITALAVFRLWGYEREYLWFPRAGFFIRSPLEADGVTIAEDRRRRDEDRWLQRSARRERRARRPERDQCAADQAGANFSVAGDAAPPDAPDDGSQPAFTGSVEDIVSQSFEPDFIRSANFLQFTFDRGRYALVGRERMLDRDVLKIEYYPTVLFRDERCATAEAPAAKREGHPTEEGKQFSEADFEAAMNKVSLVTLWVDPAAQQILRFEFRNIDMDFLPGRQFVQIDGMRATMQMSEPFPDVWLPASISMRFRAALAVGPVEGKYEVKYTNYRLPTVSGRVR
jgi:hypothetical protein